jgi:hypothetical protein
MEATLKQLDIRPLLEAIREQIRAELADMDECDLASIVALIADYDPRDTSDEMVTRFLSMGITAALANAGRTEMARRLEGLGQ